MPTRTRIVTIGVVLALVACGTGAFAVASRRSQTNDSAVLAALHTNVAVPLSGLHESQLTAQMLAAQVAAVPDASKKSWLDQQSANDAEIDTRIAAYEAATPKDFAGWKEFVAGWAAWTAARDSQLMPMALANDRAGYARVLTHVSEPLQGTYLDNLEKVEGAVTTYTNGVAASAAADAASAIRTLIISLALALVVIIPCSILTSQAMRRQLGQVRDSLEAMAAGDLTATADVNSRDEIGEMAQSLAKAQKSLRSTMAGVTETAQTVASAAEEMSAANAQVSASSAETSARAGVVAAAAEEVSRNVQTAASGAQEMGASIREIAQNANEAARVSARATGVAETTTDTITKLGVSSAEIGNVVKAITSIAEISVIIASINDYQRAIASAVEEQTATTNEMSRSVAEAATGSGEIAVNITGVASGASSASQVLAQMGGSVNELARMAADLRGRVAAFSLPRAYRARRE